MATSNTSMSQQTLGLALASLSAFTSSSGMALQRLSKTESDQREKAKKKREGFDWKGVGGFFMVLGSQPLNIVALTFCSPSVMTALQSTLSILTSICISLFFNGDALTLNTLLAMVFGIGGAVGTVSLAPETNAATELDQILRLLSFWEHPRVLMFMTALVGLTFACAMVIHLSGKVDGRTKAAQQQKVWLAFAYPFFAASTAKLSEFSFKSVGQILLNGFAQAWSTMPTKSITALLGAAFFGPFSIFVGSLGARNQDAKIFIPAKVAIANVIAACYSLALGEFDNESQGKTMAFVALVGVTLLSVYFSNQESPKTAAAAAKETQKTK